MKIRYRDIKYQEEEIQSYNSSRFYENKYFSLFLNRRHFPQLTKNQERFLLKSFWKNGCICAFILEGTKQMPSLKQMLSNSSKDTLILENEKIMSEDLYAARAKTEDELNSYTGDLIDSFEDDLVNDLGLTDDSPVMINGVEDIIHGDPVEEEEIKDTDEVVLEENNNLDNVIGGMSTNEFSNKVLDLNNVEFNYRELLDLIDAYSDIGPTIDDVVHDSIESEKKHNNE